MSTPNRKRIQNESSRRFREKRKANEARLRKEVDDLHERNERLIIERDNLHWRIAVLQGMLDDLITKSSKNQAIKSSDDPFIPGIVDQDV